MARMTKDGKTATVPPEKVAAAQARGWTVLPDSGETEGADMSVGEPAAKPTNPVADAGKAFATGASRWATLGMDDEASGVMTGLLEAVSPTSLSDEGDDVLTRLEKGYRQGKTDRRALVDDMSKRSPTAYNTGAGAGAGLAAALTPATAGARTLAAGIAGPGLADVDLGRREAPAEAARSVATGLVGGAVFDKATSVAAPAILKAVTAATEKLQTLQPAARAAAIDALDAIVKAGGPKAAALKKIDDVVKGAASKAVDKLRPATPAPPAAPAPPAPPVDNSFAEAMAQDAMARRLGGLVDEPMPTMPPRSPRTPADQIPAARNPRTPADQIPKAPSADPLDELVTARMPPASEPMSTVVPVVTKNSSAGNIAQAVEATAVQLGTTDLATIANALKLPTTLVADPLKNAVSRFAFREAVKASAGKAAPMADDAAAVLKEIAAEGRPSTPGVLPDEAMAAINQAKREVPRSLLPGDRPMAQVAGANQGAEMRAAYEALSPEQRVAWIATLRRQGLDDEKIRTMLGITKAKWRQTSFNR